MGVLVLVGFPSEVKFHPINLNLGTNSMILLDPLLLHSSPVLKRTIHCRCKNSCWKCDRRNERDEGNAGFLRFPQDLPRNRADPDSILQRGTGEDGEE